MKQFYHLFKLILLIAVMVGCAAINKPDLTSENLHTLLERLAIKNNICAVTFAVIKSRKIDSIDSVTGCQSLLTLNPDSVFQAASLGKPVFAFAVLKLVDQGILDLDTPVVKYLPQGYLHQSNPFETKPSIEYDLVNDPRFQAITVRMILNHTSGLPNWAHGPLSFELTPGTEWLYSGEGYVLLQRVVEAVTGESLDQFMIKQVFKPLGMSHSDYVWSPRLDQNLIPAMTPDGIAIKPWHFKTSIAAATLYTSVEDYAKFVANVLNNDYLLKQLAKSPITVEPRLNLSWGLGWGIERSEDDLFIWHWGNNPGYRAFVMASVQSGDGLIMLTNSDNGLALSEPITNKVLPSSEHKVFQFYMLRDGLAYFMCEALGFCI